MKFLITESQLDFTVQTMIDQTLMEFSKHCDYPDADNWPDWLGFDDCNTYDSIKKIKVISTDQVKSVPGLIKITSKYPLIKVLVDIEFSSIFTHQDFSDFFISLRYRIQQKYKITLNIEENELINTNTNKQW
jgi:hypothetical protein